MKKENAKIFKILIVVTLVILIILTGLVVILSNKQ